MCRKSSVVSIIIGIMCVLCVLPVYAEEYGVVHLSPEFLSYGTHEGKIPYGASDNAAVISGGSIPSPIDRSNLWKNPPRRAVSGSGPVPLGSSLLPVSYDLREHSRVGDIRNQNPWNSCWAFAAAASLESSYMTKYSGTSPDLAELHLAYFVYGDTRTGKSFTKVDSNKDILNQGGNADQAIAFLSRVGTVSESILPYPSGSYSYTAPALYPESYDLSGIRLKDAYSLGTLSGDTMMDIVKELIMNNGSAKISYYAGDGAYASTVDGTSTTAYYNNSGETPNHGVVIIGWDDDFAVENFSEDMRPSTKGAWLVRNSWGASWGEGGYFYMSYEQEIQDVTVFIAEASHEKYTLYCHDDLGECSNTSYSWAANVFKASDDEQLKHIGLFTTSNNQNYQLRVYDLGTDTPSSPVSSTLLASMDLQSMYAGYHTVDVDNTVILSADHYFSIVMNANDYSAVEMAVQWKNGGYYAEPVVNAGESYFSDNGTSWTDGATIKYSNRNDVTPTNACLKAFTLAVEDEAEDPGIAISPDIFPDENFRAYVSSVSIDKNQDGHISTSEIQAAAVLDVSGMGIASLKGIEIFTSLDALYCGNNNLASLDVTSLDLTSFDASGQNITGLHVTQSSDKYYYVVLTECVSLDSGNVSADSYDKTSGIIILSSLPENVTYYYDTGFSGTSGRWMSVTLSPSSAPSIVTGYLPDSLDSADYSVQLEALGDSPITWSTTSTLPSGLALSESGLLAGTLGEWGSFDIVITASNSSGTDAKTLTLSVYPVAPVISADSNLGRVRVNRVFSAALTATGSTPITWSHSDGDMPSGLEVSTSGVISGTPAAAGSYTFTVKAANAAGEDSKDFTLEVYRPYAVISEDNSTILQGVDSTDYSFTFTVDSQDIDSDAVWTWAITGQLPSGLSFDSGTIYGTPEEAGSFDITITLTVDDYVDSKDYTLVINAAAPVIQTAALPAGRVGDTYSAQLEAAGTAPITFTVTGLPAGLSSDTSGIISGIPTEFFSGDVTITAANSADTSDTKTVSLLIVSADSDIPEIAVNAENFPDEAFRTYVQNLDTDHTMTLTISEREAVGVMNVRGLGIADLTGIEYFTCLVSLDCGENMLATLDLSKNSSLDVLIADGQTLTGLVFTESDGVYTTDLTEYVSGDTDKVSSVKASGDISGRYDNETGLAVFGAHFGSLSYEYDAGFEPHMTVTIYDENFTPYDESVKDVGISGLSVLPRFAMPHDPSDDAYSTANKESSTEKFWENVLVSHVSERNAKTVFDELKAGLISEDTSQLAAVVLPEFTVSEDARYMFRLLVDNIPDETKIFLYDAGIASSDYAFMTDSGESISTVSGDDYINVIVKLKAGTYAPVLTAEASSDDVSLIAASMVTPAPSPSPSPSPTPSPAPASPDVSPDISPDVSPDISPDVSPDVSPDISPDVSPDVSPDISPDVSPDISPDIPPDIPASPDVRPESPDVPVSPDISPDVEPVSPGTSIESPDTPVSPGISIESPDEPSSPTVEPEAALPDAPAIDVQDSEIVQAIISALQQILDVITGSTEVVELPEESAGTQRDELSDEELAQIPESEDVAVILPVIVVTRSAVYVFGVQVNIPAGTPIALHMMAEQSGFAGAEMFDAAAANSEVYTFLDDDGNEIDTVPENQHINIAAYMEEGYTYAPVITIPAQASSESGGSGESGESGQTDNGGNSEGGTGQTTDNNTDTGIDTNTNNNPGDSGGGCEVMSSGLAALALALLIKRKH